MKPRVSNISSLSGTQPPMISEDMGKPRRDPFSWKLRSWESGFTFAELMVVCAVMGLILAVSLPLGTKWLDSYRFSAACRSFYNAVHLAKINAMSGSSLFEVEAIDMGGSSNEFKIRTKTFVFNCDETASTYEERGYPVDVNSSVILTGFNDPSYVNGNVFLVKTRPTEETVPPTTLGNGQCEGKLTMTLYSTKVSWSPPPGTEILSKTGRAWTAAVATFITHDDSDTDSTTYERTTYYVEKGLDNDTVRCEYDPSFFHIEINGVSVAAGSPQSVVFDSSGCPKDLQPYTIKIMRMKNGAVATDHPPFLITVKSSGKIYAAGG
jgi:Tfp pilus assembly major pilin PilA